MSNIVELNLDDTLADFEVQDWIDNVFSVQYPYIQATIKKGCQGNCGDKYKEENEQLKTQIEKMKNCANCKFGYLGEADMFENCRNCTMMYCICQKTKKEMNWDEKCDSWELAE